jgi:hypothetical protein
MDRLGPKGRYLFLPVQNSSPYEDNLFGVNPEADQKGLLLNAKNYDFFLSKEKPFEIKISQMV